MPDFDTGLAPPFALLSFSAPANATAAALSQVLTCGGVAWRLKVYARGNEAARGEYLSVFLECCDTFGGDATTAYQYRVDMVRCL